MTTTAHAHPSFATTLAHGFSVLQCFQVGLAGLSNKELVDRTGLSKATISRLTYTFMRQGLLTHDPQSRKYHLGPSVLSLGYPLLAGIDLRQTARPIMKKLAEFAGGTSSLGIYDRLSMVYIETSRGHDLMSFRPDIGARLPLLTTALGRAWLSTIDTAEQQSILDQLKQKDLQQATLFSNLLTQVQAEFKKYGYCVSEGDWQPDVHAIAVPLKRKINGDTLVLNCGVTVTRLGTKNIHELMSQRILQAAAQIENNWVNT